MKLQYCSDLHLEFSDNSAFLKKYPLQVKGDILLLAGDVVPFSIMDKHTDFFDFVADNFQSTYWLPGNHEYYHGDAALRSGTLNEKIRSNVFLVNNIAIDIATVKLIFSTMWSHISPQNDWQIQRSMSDFHVIKYNGLPFTPAAYNQLHADALNFIKQEVAKSSDNKKVVITHHVPTYMHYPKQYKDAVLSEGFTVELFDLIESSDILAWIYGHHHVNTPAFKIGNTLLTTNQLGYVKYGESKSFVNDKVLIVE